MGFNKVCIGIWSHIECFLQFGDLDPLSRSFRVRTGFLEKSLKSKSALKSTGKSLKGLEKSMNSTIFYRT